MTIIFYVLGALVAEVAAAVFIGKCLRAGRGRKVEGLPRSTDDALSQTTIPTFSLSSCVDNSLSGLSRDVTALSTAVSSQSNAASAEKSNLPTSIRQSA